MAIEDKIETLKEIKKKSIYKANVHKKKYYKMKKYDDYINVGTSLLNALAIVLIISGIGFQPLLIASGACSGASFIISTAQKTYNLKDKSESHRLSYYQYKDLSREINSTLLRNHMSSDEYQNFIEYINDKISLIEDTEI